MNLNILEEYKEYIGIALFAISVICFLYLFINPAMDLYIHTDEQFTLAILTFPFDKGWELIVNDVHPPSYYLILMAFSGLFNIFHIPVDLLYLTKLLSLLPFAILIIVSYTKIRKEFGWLTSGIFLFALSTMATMSIVFITSRMYGWSILFLVMAFIYYIDVLKDSNRKSWILLTVFTSLCMYTHYILIFPLVIMYLLYFLYIEYNDRIDKKTETKKILKSAAASILLYVPWIFTLMGQLGTVNKTYLHTTKLSSDSIINFLTCFVLQDTKQLTDLIFWKFLILILAIILLILFITEIKRFKDYEAFSVFSGFNIYVFSILIASFMVTFIFKDMTVRYFVPIITVLWLSIAILLSKVKNYKLLTIVLVLILALGVNGIVTNINDINYHNELGLKEQNVTNSINNPDSVVIYNSTYVSYHHLLNNTKEYSLKKSGGVTNPSYIYEENLTKIIEDNPDKNVYLISQTNNITNQDIQYPDNITAKKLSRQARIWIMQLTQKTSDDTLNDFIKSY